MTRSTLIASMTLASAVTPQMREPILRVLAYPSKADYITGTD